MKQIYCILLLIFNLFVLTKKLQAIETCYQEIDDCMEIAIAPLIIHADGSQTYQFEVINNCDSGLSNVAFELPSGETAVEPADNSNYIAENCNYNIENTANNPFYSIKFEANCADGIKNGATEFFEFTLSADAIHLTEIRISAKAGNKSYEITLPNCLEVATDADADSDSSVLIEEPNDDDNSTTTIDVCDNLTAGEVSSEGLTELSICLGDATPDVLNFESVGQTNDVDYVFIITNAKGLIEGGFVGNSFDFSDASLGICHIYGVAYTGDLIAIPGEKITTVVATGCAAVSINSVMLNREVVPNCGFEETDGEDSNSTATDNEPSSDDETPAIDACHNLTAGEVSSEGLTELSICLGDATSDVLNFESVGQTNDVDYAFIITNAKGLIEGGFIGNSFDFSDASLGICYIYGVAYTGDLIAMPGEKITTVVATGCAAVSVNAVMLNREVVPNCGFDEDEDGNGSNEPNDDDDGNIIVADPDNADITPTGDCTPPTYEVCTAPIVPVEICPEFCLTGDYEIIEATTNFHCNLTLDGGCITYRSVPNFKGKDVIEAIACDLTGKCDTTWISVRVSKKCPDACQAKAGKLKQNVQNVCTTESIEGIVSAAPTIPEGGSLWYLLTSGEHYSIQAISDTPEFSNLAVGIYRIHSLVLAPNTMDIDTFVMGETSIFDIHQQLQQGSGFICGALWLRGAKFNVEACDAENPCQPQIQRACVQKGDRTKICPRFCLENDYWIESIDIRSNNEAKILQETCIRYIATDKKFLGVDQLLIKACDKEGNCETAYIEVSVSETGDCDNDAPIALSDERTTSKNTAITIDVLTNDSDPNGDPFSITAYNKTSAYNGKITKSGDELIYTPKNGFIGMDDFTYQICDAFDACVTAQVWINVEDGPCDNTITTCTELQKGIRVCPNFCTLSDNYAIKNVHTNFKSSIQIINNEQCIRYTPLYGFKGAEVITVEACDSDNNCETARINMMVSKDCDKNSGKMANKIELPVNQVLELNNIYPNPANKFVQLSFSTANNKVQLQIFNVSGQLIDSQVLKTQLGYNTHQWNVENYPEGMYFLRLTTGQLTMSGRFVKQQ